jgi:hypothetical protein
MKKKICFFIMAIFCISFNFSSIGEYKNINSDSYEEMDNVQKTEINTDNVDKTEINNEDKELQQPNSTNDSSISKNSVNSNSIYNKVNNSVSSDPNKDAISEIEKIEKQSIDIEGR